jgi:hypothetical protein
VKVNHELVYRLAVVLRQLEPLNSIGNIRTTKAPEQLRMRPGQCSEIIYEEYPPER